MDDHLRETRIDGEIAYDGHFLKVSRDRIRLPDGKETSREFIRHPGAVVILPLFDDGRVLLERQFRYPNGRVFIEFPAGKIDPGEASLASAQRELEEKRATRPATGMRSARFTTPSPIRTSTSTCSSRAASWPAKRSWTTASSWKRLRPRSPNCWRWCGGARSRT